jgi:hypothetical protein
MAPQIVEQFRGGTRLASRLLKDCGMNWRSSLRLGIGVALAIAAGCGTDTADPRVTASFAADPPSVYVAKVKNILVGLPPTDAEVAQVVADPATLGGLVDGWMKLPEYQQKMMVFFELAFQQTQITATDFVDLVPPSGLGVGRSIPLLVQNARESFARTVLQLTSEGKPLTEAFSTRRLMMTPALMELYAFLDARRVDNAGRVTDLFAAANAGRKIVMQTAAGRVPIAETLNPASPNYMHWYTPDLPGLTFAGPDVTCTGLDPISFNANAQALHAMLYGEIPVHPTGATPAVNCNRRVGSAMSAQVVATDFTSWKMVTLRAPRAAEAITAFYDLPKLRTTNELVLGTPRVGYFSTPAFFANWPTNDSNQMRVTANQALIVATGFAVDGQDTTAPATTPGLDGEHATPGTPCFGCHQQLDPTRSILASTYSWYGYPQTDVKYMSEPGLFAFQSVIRPLRTIDDFGKILAQHPLVPQAWAQKLCYYVNSAPCNPLDPEFIRVVEKYTASGSWNTLIRELLASPITTNAAKTETAMINGPIVAVSRRDHLCAALNNRLGFVDICQLDATFTGGATSPLAQIVSGMPSDGYGRGATVPVLPNQPTLFYRAGLENVCATVAALVVDAAANPGQPNAKKWSSTQPEAAVGEIVTTMLAMSASDSRAAKATEILSSHFRSAVAKGAAARDALRSTFVAACLSPSFIGIGM